MKNYNFRLFFYTIWGDVRQKRMEWLAKKLGAKIDPGWSDGRITVRIPVNQPWKYRIFLFTFRCQVKYQFFSAYTFSPARVVAHRPILRIYKGRRRHSYREKPLLEIVVLWVINFTLRIFSPLILFVKKRLPKSS